MPDPSTMRRATAELVGTFWPEMSSNHRCGRRDPRITPVVGCCARHPSTSCPQLWNVERGAVSSVDPRQIVRAEVARHGRAPAIRFAVPRE